MNLINLRSQRLAPYLIFIFIVTIFFTVISVSAYQIEFDPIPQMKGIQQWLRGESTLLNSLVTVNPKDISQNLQTLDSMARSGCVNGISTFNCDWLAFRSCGQNNCIYLALQ